MEEIEVRIVKEIRATLEIQEHTDEEIKKQTCKSLLWSAIRFKLEMRDLCETFIDELYKSFRIRRKL